MLIFLRCSYLHSASSLPFRGGVARARRLPFSAAFVNIICLDLLFFQQRRDRFERGFSRPLFGWGSVQAQPIKYFSYRTAPKKNLAIILEAILIWGGGRAKRRCHLLWAWGVYWTRPVFVEH
jgi:hypothetical protein